MLKSFCDKCNSPTDRQTTLFPDIYASFGLQVTPVRTGGSGGTLHICDECFAGLLLKSASTLAQTKVVEEYLEAMAIKGRYDTDIANLVKRNNQLESQEKTVATRYKEIDKRTSELTKREAYCNEVTAQTTAAQDILNERSKKLDDLQSALDTRERMVAERLADTSRKERTLAASQHKFEMLVARSPDYMTLEKTLIIKQKELTKLAAEIDGKRVVCEETEGKQATERTELTKRTTQLNDLHRNLMEKGTEAANRTSELNRFEARLRDLESKLEAEKKKQGLQQDRLADLERDIIIRRSELDRREDEFNKKESSLLESNAVLEAQLKQALSTRDTLIKQEVSRRLQEQIDERDNPDAASSIRRREMLRASK